MRDPKRIDCILELLGIAWKQQPDQRLGQFLSNLLGPGPHDLFFLEDHSWEHMLASASGSAPKADAAKDGGK